jgi:hypothetical protein
MTIPAPPVCGWQPPPGIDPAAPCPACGHAAVVHIGCDACPLCQIGAVLALFAGFGHQLTFAAGPPPDPLATPTLGEDAIRRAQQGDPWPPP